MKYNFDEIIDRRGSHSIKWEAGEMLKKYGITERFDAETIPLFVADMDFPIPAAVLTALHERVDQRMFGYTYHMTDNRYIEALLSWFSRRHNWQINPQHVIFSPGTVHAMDVAVQAFTDVGDKVMIQRPVYPPFTRIIEGRKRVVSNNELIDDNGIYRIDFDDFARRAADPACKLFFLCHPHNPVGRIWAEEELRQMAALCERHDVLIVSDEIHADLIRSDARFTTLANIADPGRIVVCTAINKTFNVAGLHCSNIVISEDELRRQYSQTMGMQMPSPFAISALIAAYNEGEDWLRQLREYLDNNFTWLEKFLRAQMPQVKFSIPAGTYIAWLDFSAYGLTPAEVHARIYNRANVVLEDGAMFGEKSAHYQRLCLPSPRPLLEQAWQRIAAEF
jgi:cystathionine beta-lyase